MVEKKTFSWSMNEAGNEVTVKNGKLEIKAIVIELSEHKLVFSREDEGMVVTTTLTR